MQWSAEEHAGFSTVEPWIRVHDNYEANVVAQQNDSNSVFAMWKEVLKLRKEYGDVLIHGQFEVFDFENLYTFTYVKDYEGRIALVALNFSDEEQNFDIPSMLSGRKLDLLIANVDQLGNKLSPWEGRAYLID